ncbi:MAG: UDP-N-acetylmuramoyl-tripeptide--D-alanyl-D-alanine ligase [Thermomonas sp.]|uniref:UDP-N-acetylmuramoyl-tripeptide--D-alanyl-D- alanine ligase n=1 Tax=Thermomonas sp. TaxID=1971895 RepID=UPI001ED56A7E|nr:UDP-N-acetylmuramoyl-tripeptide--D-alanyl-D-alanine ligase [Thermomonas sp.]MBV2210246.1 UDP-N-acetylmuramoyl-tripeptide--D-alanyl-D-alanine ligase [Thermomonas sp.]
MKPRSLSWIAHAVDGRLVGADGEVDGVATDTRTLPAGKPLFVAFKGEHFDGHSHVQAALEGGCVAALVAHSVAVAIPQIIVDDTERALGRFAAAVQHERSTKVLAVTGSNGKTTVKTLLLSILQQMGGAYANPGNRNNEIGLPLAVLDAPEDARFAVYEMGAGKPGDIAYLTAIARPDVALVNNVASAHLERMGSLLGVAETKGAIYTTMAEDGVAVINADDAFALYFQEHLHGRKSIRFGLDTHAEVSARAIHAGLDGSHFTLVLPSGEVETTIALPGLHNVRNALAAAAMAHAVGATHEQIGAGLAAAEHVNGRLDAHHLSTGVVLIDDSYNANPGSLAAAIETLSTCEGAAWLVLGDMRELGEDEAALHAQGGSQARRSGIARLYALGALSAHAAAAFGDGGVSYPSHEALIAALQADLHPGVTVLVKGSRGSAMDKIVKALLKRDAESGKETTDAA